MRLSLRIPACGCLALLLVLSALLQSLAAAEGLVFLPSAPSQDALTACWSADGATKGMKVTVADSQRTFATALKTPDKIDFVIGSSALQTCLDGYIPALQFVRGDAKTWEFAIISIDAKFTAANLGQGTVALVDELGKKGSDDWLATVLPGQKLSKIRRGKDPDDIFKMLGLEIAQYCLLEPPSVERITKEFKGKIASVLTSKTVPLPQVFLRKGGGDLAAQLGKLDAKTLEVLGFTGLVPIAAEGK